MKPGLFRLLLAVTVLFQHSTPLRLGNWAVFVFFTLSGYWISRLWEGKYRQKKHSALVFLISRWWRLFPMFFLCSLLCLATFALVPKVGAMPSAISYWLLRQIPIAGSAFLERPLGPSWSLDVEMQFYILSAGLMPLLLSRQMRSWWLLAFLVLILIPLGVLFLCAGGSVIYPALPFWLCFFLAGVLIHKMDYRPGNLTGVGFLLLVLAGFAIVLLVPTLRDMVWLSGTAAGLARAETITAGALMSYAGALLLIPFVAYNVRQESGPLDRWLGNLAYPLYLFHWMPRMLYYQCTDWSKPWYYNLLLLLTNFTASILGACLLWAFVDRPLDRARGRWVDGLPVGILSN